MIDLKKIKFDHSLVSFWLHLSSLLIRCVKDVVCKQNEQLNLYMFNVIYMRQIPCVLHWTLFATCFLSRGWICFDQSPRIFLGIICQNPILSKCNQLHVDIFFFFLINLRHIWKDSCEMMSTEHDVLNLN